MTNHLLLPLPINQFSAFFETDQEVLLEFFNIIENQLSSVDMGAELLSGNLVEHRTQKIILWLVDTEGGLLMNAIRTIQRYPFNREFNFKVKLNDGFQQCFETYSFLGCRFDAMQHSVLSYEQADENKIKNSMKLLQITFAQMNHEYHPLS